jgi:DNA-binding response OmpR family regulator
VPTVLAIVADTPPSMQGRMAVHPGLAVEVWSDLDLALCRTAGQRFDLLVLAEMPGERQGELVHRLHQIRRWRIVPVLYVLPPEEPGLVVPGSFRPEIDRIVRARFRSPEVIRLIEAMAREGIGDAEAIVAGTAELDPLRGRLRVDDREIILTRRETEILAVLMQEPGRTIPFGELVERGWQARPDGRNVQILRRHISNIRRKLEEAGVRLALRTVRGTGYRLQLPRAS